MDRPSGKLSRITCTALIIVHALLLVWSAVNNSVTFDEFAHLPAGVAYWKHGWRAFGLYNLSPPLVRLLAAAPVVIAGVESPDVETDLARGPRNAHWDYGRRFEQANAARYQRIFVIGRLGLLPVSCFGLWLVWRWANELYGAKPALAASALWAFNPDLIAHGSLVGTDATTAVAMLAATYAWWRFCDGRERRRFCLIVAASAFAAAQLCKFTALLLLPMFVAIAVVQIVHRTIGWRWALIGLATCSVMTWLMVNLVYGFRGSLRPQREFSFQSQSMQTLERVWPDALPFGLPREFVAGFDVQKYESEIGVPAFALGEAYTGSRWYYYPVALACKLPVGAIGLILLAFSFCFAGRHVDSRREIAPLAALLVFGLFIVILADVNIGVRYILPAYPFAIILITRTWRDGVATTSRFWSVPRVGWVLLLVFMLESLLAAPRYLSFINVAAGGQSAGWRTVNDSNFDWGQGLLDLKRWSGDHGNPSIAMAYFGRVNPKTYGIHYSPITAPAPEASVVAVSTYYLNGLSHRLPVDNGATDWVSLPYASELRETEPLDRAGPTIYLYRADDVAIAARRTRQSR